ncbi:MAG: ABC transporter permease [Anaerolineae bacterium]|nr:ABC transporter permease [Anaerolineae bacterium]MCB9130265.1 ABC transporter permease [Anaerolineales bacterium]MCB0251227.1 ABC transporter permease [Anaerolineae bacterium]MCB9142750.1 ABC transporter permease [Anaerolineales bacterium]MCO5243215.1 ABC transporter permease [Anaerolineae bacterium]
MTQLTYQMRASYAFIERNFNLVRRYWGWEVVWLAYTIANALAVAFIGVGAGAITGQEVNTDYFVLYLVIGTLVWHFLSVVFDNLSEVIAWERWEGTIEYTFMAPVHRMTHMAGQTLFSLTYGLLHTGIVLVAVAAFFKIDLSQANMAGALMVLIAGSFSFIGFGIMASVLPLLFPERGAQMTHVFQAILLLFSGVYYPISVLPEWMQKVAMLSPATYVLAGMREALLENATMDELWKYIWPLLVAAAIAIPVGLKVFNSAERYAKRTGKLKRNG